MTDQPGYQHAVEEFAEDNQGGTVFLPVANPSIRDGCINGICGSGHSMAQVWAYTNGTTQSVEAGWNVDLDVYNDNGTHLFVYSTTDGYTATGCFNGQSGENWMTGMTCPTWVQTSQTMTPGMALSTGQTINIEVTNFYGGIDGLPANWWVYASSVEGTDYLGYYAAADFAGNLNNGVMQTHAQRFAAGGEVFDPRHDFFQDPMGSGNCSETEANAGSGDYYWNLAAWIANAFGEDFSVDWSNFGQVVTQPHSYNLTLIPNTPQPKVMNEFYIGGPGSGQAGALGPCCPGCP